MARYLIYDGEGANATGRLFGGLKVAIEHAIDMLFEETLHKREPEAFVTTDRRCAMVGFWHDEENFEPYYFIRSLQHA